MSDDKEPPKPPAAPKTKTSTVPLKKETVRITLKSKPGEAAAASGAPKKPAAPAVPKVAPIAPKSPAAPATPAAPKAPAPSVGGAPKAPAPAAPKGPAAPKAPAPAAPKAPAPSIGGGAKAPAPAAPKASDQTGPVRVKPVAAPAAGKSTQQLKSEPAGKAGTKPLPKATVKLKPTQSVTPKTPTILSGEVPDDDGGEEGLLTPFALLAVILSVVLLAVQLMRFVA